MFERFTGRARKVLVLAQDETARFGHNYVGTEHILLGLTSEGEGVAAQVLRPLGVTVDGVREQVGSIVGFGEGGTSRQVPFTPRSKKVFELALRESLRLGHNYIGTEHILLGLVGEGEGVAARVLHELEVDPGAVRREVLWTLGEEAWVDRQGEASAGWDQSNRRLFRGRIASLQVETRVGRRPRKLLVDMDYEYEPRDEEASGVLDHDRLLEQVADVLEGREYPSVEASILEAGNLVLERFPAVHEVEISAFEERFSERQTISGITVSHTLRW